LGWNDYIRIHITPTLTYLRTSLQTSLQNQTKQEGNEKDDFVRHEGIDTHPKKVTFLTMAYIEGNKGINTHLFFSIQNFSEID
jgi:hypothetical protein